MNFMLALLRAAALRGDIDLRALVQLLEIGNGRVVVFESYEVTNDCLYRDDLTGWFHGIFMPYS